MALTTDETRAAMGLGFFTPQIVPLAADASPLETEEAAAFMNLAFFDFTLASAPVGGGKLVVYDSAVILTRFTALVPFAVWQLPEALERIFPPG